VSLLDADAVWLVLLALEVVVLALALLDVLPDAPFSKAVRSVCNCASSDCSSLASWSASVADEVLLLELAVDDALAVLVAELLDAESFGLGVPGGGGGVCCCNSASKDSSALSTLVEDELSLLELTLEALLALVDALEPSVLALDELSVVSPDRKLTLSSWKNAGGAMSPARPLTMELLSLLLALLDELLLVSADVRSACSRCCSCCHCWKTSACERLLTLMKGPPRIKGLSEPPGPEQSTGRGPLRVFSVA
jgi:hypothetical protein